MTYGEEHPSEFFLLFLKTLLVIFSETDPWGDMITTFTLLLIKRRHIHALANKLVNSFVETGARWENGCLSAQTRQALLTRDVHCDFFVDAQREVARDILFNQTLSSIIETYARKINLRAL